MWDHHTQIKDYNRQSEHHIQISMKEKWINGEVDANVNETQGGGTINILPTLTTKWTNIID